MRRVLPGRDTFPVATLTFEKKYSDEREEEGCVIESNRILRKEFHIFVSLEKKSIHYKIKAVNDLEVTLSKGDIVEFMLDKTEGSWSNTSYPGFLGYNSLTHHANDTWSIKFQAKQQGQGEIYMEHSITGYQKETIKINVKVSK